MQFEVFFFFLVSPPPLKSCNLKSCFSSIRNLKITTNAIRRCHCNSATKKDDIEITRSLNNIFTKLILYDKWEENSTSVKFRGSEVIDFHVLLF